MEPTWGPSGADRTQVGPMLAPWTLLSGLPCAYRIWVSIILILYSVILVSLQLIFPQNVIEAVPWPQFRITITKAEALSPNDEGFLPWRFFRGLLLNRIPHSVVLLLSDGGRGSIWWLALSGHWLTGTGFWRYLISMKWFKYGIPSLHLSVP